MYLMHTTFDRFFSERRQIRVLVFDVALFCNHERLTYRYGGRDYRLTDVYGQVATKILA